MDLGLTGRTAFVCASSQGLGLACATALAREGAAVTLNGRNAEKLARVAHDLRDTFPGARVDYVAADLNTAGGRAAILGQLPEVDILVTNNEGPKPGGLESWDEAALIGAMEMNMIPAVQLMRAYIPGMRARKFGRIVNITSAMVKSPRYFMGLSTAARTALTAISKAVAREVVADNVTVNNLMPEKIDTPRQDAIAAHFMKTEGLTRDQVRARTVSTIAAKRFGEAAEFGDACAFLCAAQAGYISGQNLQLDGGTYEGLI
ncbi:SDR family NAD(P)-dependent oxidoreductase [Paenirhodobacter populi]|uniref:SDR family NAD(P)-dependent oxidoreductase n=1 Tax=Paenirhodobacter populi TaxID=2306993 RepID=UPI000FE41AA5|nr:SDR family oxidoreductase [Sinirhodobacter populi]RWR06177.1 SDR family NAD(P)-dependent oxidoreductase [Sinirhodobacter populi]